MKATRMPAQQRRDFITNEVLRSGEVDVGAMAKVLGVSSMTVRRDLSHLDQAGVIRRVHGGATQERALPALRSATMSVEKTAIANLVASEVQQGDTVGLDVGSTCTAVARALSARPDITVVTNSLHAALEFENSEATVLLIGGRLTPEGSTVGTRLSDDTAINVDKLILGCGGLDAASGITYHDWDENIVRRQLLSRAASVILATDHTKFEQVKPYQLGHIEILHTLITDEPPKNDLSSRLGAAEVKVRALSDS